MPTTHPSTRERRVATNGIELHLVEAGPEDGPPVVLCHGFPELSYSWRHQIPALADAGYRVLAPDQRGYGESDRPEPIEDYDIHHLTDDLLGLLDDIGAEQGGLRRPRLGLDGRRPDGAAPPRSHDRGDGDERPAAPPRARCRRCSSCAWPSARASSTSSTSRSPAWPTPTSAPTRPRR